MNPSIKRFLLIYLLFTITLISAFMMIGTYLLDGHALKRNFDSELQQTEFFFQGLIESNPSTDFIKRLQATIDHVVEHNQIHNVVPISNQIEFRLWNQQGDILLTSHHLPIKIIQSPLTLGFTSIQADGDHWRTLVSYHNGMTILIAEKYNLSTELLHQLTWNNFIMLLWGYPLLGLFIWLSIDRGLSSLRRLTDDIVKRQATRLDIVDVSNVPIEVKPLVEALNRLFLRLYETFERNKRFSADAAHELRTPLAALKTQAQVALKVSTEEERKAGLRNVILGVDRCTHIVQQLLTLSRLAPEAGLQDIQYFNLSNLTAEIVAQLVPDALKKNIEIELVSNQEEVCLYGNETFIAILIRNLVDNAIRYTPQNGEVRIQLSENTNQTRIKIIDSGPGIPKELRTRVFERFYRVLGTTAPGSGLGLAIVQQIAELHNAQIELSTPASGKGLEISIVFPDSLYCKINADH